MQWFIDLFQRFIGRFRRLWRDLFRIRPSVPTLAVAGDKDPAIDSRMFNRAPGAFTGAYEQVIWEGVGHFPHRERPKEFADKVLDYLGKPETKKKVKAGR